MKRYILLALSVCQSLVVLAAEAPRKSTDANLFGHVVDRETHEHIPYASVAVSARLSVRRPTLRATIS